MAPKDLERPTEPTQPLPIGERGQAIARRIANAATRGAFLQAHRDFDGPGFLPVVVYTAARLEALLEGSILVAFQSLAHEARPGVISRLEEIAAEDINRDPYGAPATDLRDNLAQACLEELSR